MSGLDERRNQLVGNSQSLVLALLASFIMVFPTNTAANASGPIVLHDAVCQLSGSGTTASPYLVSDFDSLYESTDCATTSSVVVKLTTNIDLAGSSQTPIGYKDSSSNPFPFLGTLDGNYKIISNLDISGLDMSGSSISGFPNSVSSRTGLFALFEDAHIQNLRVSGTISAIGQIAGSRVGGLAAVVTGAVTISNVIMNVDIDAPSTSGVGGLFGDQPAGRIFVQDSINLGRITGSFEVGGFIGVAEDVSFIGSQNEDIISGLTNVGGLVGSTFTASAISSRNVSTISGEYNVGGFFGNTGTVSVVASNNSGRISGISDTGGFVGGTSPHRAYFAGSSNSSTVSVTSNDVGGFIGTAEEIHVVSSSNNGAVVGGANDTGGFVGFVSSTATISGSTNFRAVTGQAEIGGFIGDTSHAFIESSHNYANVTGQADQVGGFIGDLDDADTTSIINSSNHGVIQGADTEIGGFIGFASNESQPLVVSASQNYGEVINLGSAGQVGGFVGEVERPVIVYLSSNAATISGITQVGGFFGRSIRTTTIDKSFNYGMISASGGAGGLIGVLRGTLEVNESFNTGMVVASDASASIPVAAGFVASVTFTQPTFSIAITNAFNNSTISFPAGSVSGLIGSIATGSVSISNVYSAGALEGSTSDGLVLSSGATFTAASSYTLLSSGFLSNSTIAQMRSSGLYEGWNFVSIWGFGSCSENNGLPLLRFAQEIASYSNIGCGITQGISTPIANPKPYEGPIISYVSSPVRANQQATVTGIRLSTITEVYVGGIRVDFTTNGDSSRSFKVPNLAPGTYELIFVAPVAQISLYGKILINLGSSDAVSLINSKVNVGSFNGRLVVYAENLKGSRISWKVGGRWGRAIANSDFARFDRQTPRRGVQVTVQVFVDGTRQLTKVVRTR